jgi:hypothetical protein
MDPAAARRRARIAAYHLASSADPKEYTKAARAAFEKRFETEVDPDGLLDPAERKRRAVARRKAYFVGLAHRSAEARAMAIRGPRPRNRAIRVRGEDDEVWS